MSPNAARICRIVIRAFTAAALLTPLERIADAVLLVEDGRIVALGPRREVSIPTGARVEDCGKDVIAPGYVDIHIHGAAGHDVMQSSAAGRRAMGRFLAAHGVTAYLPTTVSAPLDTTLRALEDLAAAIQQPERCCARAAGIHLEGPFLSHARCGVHMRENLAAPSVQLFEKFWQAGRGHIRMMTIAPELPGALEVIAAATAHGVVCAVGHSDATAEQTAAGIAAGARHATHTFNAMRPLDHREPGILGTALCDERLTADIIADGVHVAPAIVELFLHAKGPERAVLITDATSATGMGDGRFLLGTMEVEVAGMRCTRNGKLAGSVLTLDRAVCNAMNFGGGELEQAVRLATINAAHAAVLDSGRLKPGLDADFVVLTPAGEVVETICRGEISG
jgi:N-acetylglucosamine-6-phosphate deacetylase